MIRNIILYAFLSGLILLAVRYWYAALCGLLFLTVLTQHPSMPSYMFGIQGLNPWNALLLIVTFFWLINRRHDSPRSNTPPALIILISLYIILIISSGLIAAVDYRSIQGPEAEKLDFVGMIVDTIINPLKYLIIGIMFYDGTRTRQRARLGLLAAVASGFVCALLLVKSLNARVFTIDYEDARRLTDKLIGLYANDMAELFSFTIWAGLLTVVLLKQRRYQALWLVCTVAVIPPFIALKSRAGFLAVCLIGLFLGVVRFRKLLIALPLVGVLTMVMVPSARERIMMGFDNETESTDWDEVTAGRLTNIWPPSIEQITRSPLFGHGRYAILRMDCYERILQDEGRVPTHPHNSYLEVLLDSGALGLGICIACMLGIAHVCWRLFQERHNSLITTIGVVGLIAVLSELIAGVAGSSFYPTQSAVPYLCVWGIALGVWRERRYLPTGNE